MSAGLRGKQMVREVPTADHKQEMMSGVGGAGIRCCICALLILVLTPLAATCLSHC